MVKLLRRFSWVLSGMLFIVLPQIARGQGVSLTTLGSAVTQNFDVLSNTAGSTTNNLTIPGWFMTETGGGARDNEQYGVDTGGSTTGDTYSYGAAGATDRALGGLRSGTLIPSFGAAFTNNTGATITSLSINYTGEHWRLGTAGRTDQLNFEYSTDATSLTTGTWASITDLNFVTSVTATTGAKDGNDPANRIALLTTISGQTILNGATFWIRWTDVDVTGADDGLAVDDFSLTPNAIITPNLSINDVSLNEGNAGTTTFTYTVSLSAPAGPGGVTFDIATADGTATAPGDYTAKSLTSQTIPAGSSTYAFSVLVNGDTSPETNETFFVNVTNVTGATVSDSQGQGTIVNDDVTPPISATLAGSSTICSGQSANLTVTVANGTSPYSLTISDGTSTQEITGYVSGAPITVTPSEDATYTIIGLTDASSTSANPANLSGAAVVTIDVLTADLNPSEPIITCSEPIVSLTATGGTSYTLSDGQINTTGIFSVSVAGQYRVIVANASGCTATASTYVSIDNSIPEASLEVDGALSCANSVVTLTAIPYEQINYVFSAGATQVGGSDGNTATVTQAGTYSVIITGYNGCTASASVTVEFENLAPSVSIFPTSATLSCSNPSVDLSASGEGQLLWNTGATTSLISVTASGTYSVTLTQGNGCSATASAEVFQDNSGSTVSINPSSATLTCATPSVSLSAVGSGTYLWSTGATTSSISATVAGPYSVTLTGANGCTATASAQVFQNNTPPTVSIDPTSATLSCASPTVSLSAVGSGTYRWSTGAITQSISATSAGPYSVTLTGANGCTASASAQVFQNNTPPTVSINPSSATLSCTTTSVSLSAVGQGTYLWSTGATTSSISATVAGPYSVTLTGANGCTATASAQVSQDSNVPTVSITPSSATLSCTTTSVSLSAVGNGTYLWSTGATTSSISVTAVGPYSVTLTGGNGCKATATAQVTQDNSMPTVSITPSSATLSCATSSVSLSAVGQGTYLWSTGATTSSISATVAGPYSVTLTGSNGCKAIATAQVFQDNSVPSVSINPSSATLTCASPTVSLSAVGQGTFVWNTGAITQSINVNVAGPYSVTLTGTNGCKATATAQVTQDNSMPTVSINPSSATLTCTTTSVSLSAVGSGTFVWSTGATTSSISATVAGPYSVTLTGTNGCKATATAQVSQDNSVPQVSISAAPSLTIASGQSATLTASGATTYLWSTGANTTSIEVTMGGPYSVTGTTGNCTAQASVTVVQSNPPAGPFAITMVTPNTCQQIASNRYVISFTPQYVGTNGQPISFSVVNEMFPTTAPGPYTLQLYDDNPTIVLKAQQTGTPGEASFTYNWLANCRNPQPNTPPRVNQPLADQVAKVGQEFGYTIPQNTFTDNESPHSLVLTVSELPAGLSFSPPVQIGGVPTVAGVRSITVTATDPQGLSVSTSFLLTVVEQNATNTPPTVVNPIANQVATQEQPFSLNVGNTFTDAQTPNSLTLAVSGQPAGLSLVGSTLSGTPSQTGTSTVTLTATDPGGLSASTQFMLTVQPASATTSASFAITAVNPLTCTQISHNRYEISFMPVYSGLNGQPVSFSVVNEMFPTTAPGPYSLQLYNDNPTIILKATQGGSAGETSYTYNWLANCSAPQPNTPPRVNQPLTDQTAKVGQEFGYTIPQNTFTDNESPHTLVLTVSGLPAGLSFSPPVQIGGVPSVSGVSSVTVTATDPGGLSVSTTFLLTVLPAGSANPGTFSITGVQTFSCVTVRPDLRSVTFQPQYNNTNGQPIRFSVVNEMLPTNESGPYTLQLYTDNPTINLRATQQGTSGEASFSYNWLAACNNPAGRQGVGEPTGLEIVVFGNPITNEQLEVEIRNGQGQSVRLNVVNEQGRSVSEVNSLLKTNTERLRIPLKGDAGIYLLQVTSPAYQQTIKVLKQ